MSVTMEKVTIELEERNTQSINLRDTETEVEKGLGIRDDTETATRINRHTDQDGQNNTTRAAVAITMVEKRRAVVDHII